MTRVRVGLVSGMVLVAACSSAGTTAGPSPTGSAAQTAPPATQTQTPAPSETPSATAPQLEGRIFFGRFDLDLEDMTIWVIDADGSNERQLLQGAHYLSCILPATGELVMATPTAEGRLVPSLAKADGTDYRDLAVDADGLNLGLAACPAEGTRLVFEGWDDTDDARSGLYALDVAAGGSPTRLTQSPAQHHDVPGCFTPDGELLFTRVPNEAVSGSLNLVGIDGAEREIAPGPFGFGTACAADGATVVVERAGGFATVDLVDGSVVEITSDAAAYAAHKYGPALSPDGEWLVFSLQEPGPFHDLYAMRLDGTELTRITQHAASDNDGARWVAGGD